MKITSSELRQKFLKFFEKKGHKIIPSASLIPENDPTVLFTTAGMHPLVPYLLGAKHPEGKKLTSCQKCIRTGDIEEVGDDTHLTFFEMLGNWSLGDYGKEEAIKMSFEFLTKELGISLDRLAFTCFAGDENAPKDEEAAKIWESLGVKKDRIKFLGKEDNWWGPAGKTGPCGPDSEMFYWKDNNEKAPEVFDPENKNWVEIWNDVFMQYEKTEDGKYIEAKQKNIDTGMGLERTLAVLNGEEMVYKTDLFQPIIKKVLQLCKKDCGCDKNNPCSVEDKKSYRIIADHIKASVFLLSEGITPSNLGQGYIVRRLIRRAVRFGKKQGILEKNWTKQIAEIVIDIYKDVYPELGKNKNFIFDELTKEEEKFEATLEKGLKEFEKIINREFFSVNNNPPEKIGFVLGEDAFDLFQTYGFPIELTVELAKEKGMKIDTHTFDLLVDSFNKKMTGHQEISRTASAGMFKGGLADNSEQTTKLHTAAHLMLAGLRKFLGEDVFQKGSNINAERLRFDFSYPEKVSPQVLHDVENFVNGIIKKDLPVLSEEMTLEKAKELNAMGVFELKYGEKVKVYTIAEGNEVFSREICGGPHVERTGLLGHFKILKEESSSSGVRRIKAILE